ncbi:putative C-5 cytosine-specific DNA methylase [Thiomonas arsenitoxydans]|uniref:DNA (cytosine-5-)-methyltransferase n=1 Tax=Thiomonas arsenitoxydans (strain DSM 22701 / CIP 110005 / 3As) TaxID=426114 RepID=D6CVT3_THIA3|nr:DNA cytosine methyltransferase [Thiomonas arsenitoxydans]CAZ90422.1 putative C-5 cytosine-specific DNA methylase [Thiomonas arsenitoxydans]CQR32719.1 putative C-5 cytosine-specific DNA methylase [Thiomonas arsenitoxydans]
MKAIDLFSGAGGFTEGARQAGVEVCWAANHWPAAVACHSANHPEAVHACQDLEQADWRAVPAHDVLMASPACQGHSPARGKERPHHDALRSTAWAVVACAEYHRSPVVIVENVPAFTAWALYPAWCDAMFRLGYAVAPHLIDSADHGVPQHRERLFLICSLSKHPLELDLPRRAYVPARDIIEWDLHPWAEIDEPGRSAHTLRRIEAGRRAYGARFLAPYYGSGSGLTGRSIDRPIGTLTTRDRWAVIDGPRMRMLQVSEARKAMGFRADYKLPARKKEAMHLLGNAVCPPVAADLLAAIRAAA